jgi:hypothetical protein
MVKDRLEERLVRIAEFLTKHSTLFDGRGPSEQGHYFRDPDIALHLASNPELVRALSRGTTKFPPVGNDVRGKFREFWGEYGRVWLDDDSMDTSIALFSSKPDLVFDMSVRDGTFSRTVVGNLREMHNEDVKLVALDKCAGEVLDASSNPMPNAHYVGGEITEGGIIREACTKCVAEPVAPYRQELIEVDGKRAVIAIGACSYLSDYIAQFVVKHEFDYFTIVRCCYPQMQGREFLTKFEPEILFNEEVAYLLSGDQEEMEQRASPSPGLLGTALSVLGPLTRRSPQLIGSKSVGNLLFSDLFRQAVSLDFALHMKGRGYDVGVERFRSNASERWESTEYYTVYGLKQSA